jgi:predicted RecB family nuclease
LPDDFDPSLQAKPFVDKEPGRVKNSVSKSDWLAAKECATMAWFGLRADSDPPSEAALFRMQQGREIGELARQLFPNGFLVSKAAMKTAAELTQELIPSGVNELFEAAFMAGPFVAKADILKREERGWHVLEVKSSFSDKDDLQSLVDDLAYTVMVLKRSGLPVTTASLVLLSRNYRFGQGPEDLFDIIDQTAATFDTVAQFEGKADSVAKALLSETQPIPALVPACRDCDYFETSCVGSGLEHTVFHLPNLQGKKLQRLADEGVIDLFRLPEDLELTERQERAKTSVLSNRAIVEPGLAELLDAIAWPCFYLDFETVATTLPLYEGHGCHQQVLTQFSIHRRDSLDGELRHHDYLADAAQDCQHDVAKALIESLEERGAILVYSSFEKKRITVLRDALPEFAPQLQAILDRLVDILPLINDHVYHPGFKGSFSIKKVLPALVPDLSYSGLAVRDGDTAITRFARMALGEITGEAAQATRKQLLAYCEMDTIAMVRLHEALIRLASRTRHAGSIRE